MDQLLHIVLGHVGMGNDDARKLAIPYMTLSKDRAHRKNQVFGVAVKLCSICMKRQRNQS